MSEHKKYDLPADPERIIKIDPDDKYFLVMPAGTSKLDLEITARILMKWMNNDYQTIMVIAGDMTIVRIKDGEAEILYSPKESQDPATKEADGRSGESDMCGSPESMS